jgi:hypothetical protein
MDVGGEGKSIHDNTHSSSSERPPVGTPPLQETH